MKNPEEDPIFGILMIRPLNTADALTTNIPKKFLRFFSFPEFSFDSINSASEKNRAGATYKDVLLEMQFNYEFSMEFLNFLKENETKTSFEHSLFAKAVLFSFISFFVNTDHSDFDIIVDLLFNILPSNFSINALKCIHMLFKNSIETGKPNHIDLLPKLYNLFNNYSIFAKNVQDLLVFFLRALCPPATEGSKISDDAIKLMIFISNYSQSHNKFFTKETASSLLYAITTYLVLLDRSALQFFYALSPLIDSASALSLIMILPMPIRDEIESKEPFLVATDNEGKKIDWREFIEKNEIIEYIPYNKSAREQYNHPPRETFKNGIDVKRDISIIEKVSHSSLLRNDLYTLLLLIGGAASLHTEAMRALLEWIARCVKESQKSDYFFDFVAVFICLFNIASNSDFIPLFWETLFETQLFDTRINLLEHGKNLLIIDQLRTFVFNNISIDGFAYLPTLFKFFIKKPALVAEMLKRIIDKFEIIDRSVLKSSTLIMNFCSILVYFQSIHFVCAEEQIPLVETTRSFSLIFISQIITDQELAVVWFSYRIFITTFIAFIFEPALRPYVFGAIKNYLVTRNDLPKEGIMNEIIDITKIVFLRFPDERDVVLATDLLETMNEVMSHCSSDIKAFIELTDFICTALIQLGPGKVSNAFLVQALHFFAVVSPKLELKSSYIQTITSAIKKIEVNGVSQPTLTNLKQISAGTQISSVSPFYLIKQPKALKALLNVSRENAAFKEAVKFLHSLIQFTYQNSVITNQAGIDMLLLEILNEKKGTEIDQETLDYVFSIITQISMIVSSTLVVHRFLSLMFPMEGKILSEYQQKFLKKFIEITNLTLRVPCAFIPVHSQAQVKVLHATQAMLGERFTLFISLYVDRALSQAHAKIIEVLDRKVRGFNMFISSGALLFTCLGKSVESTARFDIDLPCGEWFTIAVQFEKVKGVKTAVQTFVNEQASRKLEFNWKGFKQGPLDFTIGDKVENFDGVISNMDNIPPVLVSNVTAFDKIDEELLKTFPNIPPREIAGSAQNSTISLHFEDNEGFVQPIVTSKDKNVKCKIICENPVPCFTSFIDVLCQLCKYNALIPFFSLFDLKTKSGKCFPEIPELIVELLTTVLQVSYVAQTSFFNARGMKVLSHLINESRTFPRTYNMYIRLYTMMCSLSYQPLQESIVESILCDFGILLKNDQPTQLRIVKHWRRVMLQAYPTFVTKVLPVHTLVSALHAFYEKTQIILPMTEAIRQELRNMIVDVASYSINEDDVLVLVSDAISTNNTKRVKDTLKMISEIFSCESGTQVDQLKFHIANIVLLNSVVSTGDEETLILLVNIISSVHRLGLLPSLPSQIHYELVMQNIHPSCCKSDSAIRLAEIANQGIQELIPLCLYVAMNVNDDALYDVFECLKPQKLSLHSRMWVIAAIDVSPSDIRRKGLNFLIDCETDWKDTINTIIVVCTAQRSDPYSMIAEILTIFGNKLLNEKSSLNDFDEFFTLCNEIIFFHSFKKSAVLAKEFSNSPFSYIPLSSPSVNDNDDSDSGNFERDECSFSKLRAQSMMSRSFIFVSGDHLDKQEEQEEQNNEQVARSLSHSSVQMPDVPKIKPVKKRRSSYIDTHSSPKADSDDPISPLEPNNSMLGTPTKTAFLFRPPTDAKLKFSMNDLYENIETFSKHKKSYVFSLRRDKNGRWLDIDLANLCLKIYVKNPLTMHFGFIALLSSILIHYQPIQVEKTLKQITLNSSQIKAYNLILTKLATDVEKYRPNMKIPFLAQVKPNKMKAFDALETAATTKTSDIETQKIYRNADLIVKDNIKMVSMQSAFIGLENAENIGFVMKETHKYIAQQQRTQRENQKLWLRMWNRMTMQLAIWEGASPKKTGYVFARNLTLGSYFAPIKQKCRRSLIMPSSTITPSILASSASNNCSSQCLLIKPNCDRKCFIEIKKPGINILFFDTSSTKFIPSDSINFVLQITRFGENKNIEIYKNDGKFYLFEFADVERCETVMAALRVYLQQTVKFISKPESTPLDFLNAMNATENWEHGKISNFQYLMLVNFAAGRTFCDTSIYPIFPWVISDFTSEKLDLQDSSVYRDLRKIIGSTTEEKMDELSKANNGYIFERSNLPGEFVTSVLDGDLTIKGSTISDLYKYCQDSNIEIIPEFFCYPEIFLPDNSYGSSDSKSADCMKFLPKWASSPQDFVYKNRIALESIMVSATLHFWIENIFGIKVPLSFFNPKVVHPTYDYTKEQFMKFGILPHCVFLSHHVERCLNTAEPAIKSDVVFNTGFKGVVSVAVSRVQIKPKLALELLLASRSGTIRKVIVDLAGKAILPNFTEVQFNKSYISSEASQETIQPINCKGQVGFVMTNGSSPNALFVVPSSNTMRLIRTPFGLIRSISTATHGTYLSTVCSDMTARVWNLKTNEQSRTSISSFRDYTICSAVCSEFEVIVTGTRDGSLQVCNMEGNVQRVITMKDRKPLNIHVTPGLGLIVVYAEKTNEIKRGKEIIVYTINGLLLSRSESNSEINAILGTMEMSCWNFWYDSRGIDYAAIGFQSGKIFIIELGNLSMFSSSRPIKVGTRPVSIEFISEMRILLVGAENGNIFLFPVNQ